MDDTLKLIEKIVEMFKVSALSHRGRRQSLSRIQSILDQTVEKKTAGKGMKIPGNKRITKVRIKDFHSAIKKFLPDHT